MSRRAYDLSMLAALLLGSIGAGLQWGLPVGLMAASGLVTAFTLLAFFLTGGR